MASDTKAPSRKSTGPMDHLRGGGRERAGPAPSAAAAAQPGPARRGSSRSLEGLLKTLHECALILDSEGIIQNFWSSNRPHLRPIENALFGRRLRDVVSKQTARWITRIMQEAIESGQRIYEFQPVRLADGEHFFSVSVLPIAAKPGGPKTVCLLARDITPWKASREALILREALLAQAEELANVGSWERDLETGSLHWSAHFFRMLGLPPERGTMPLGRGVEMIHPDDRERALRDGEALRIEGKPFDHELRFMTAHRGVRIFHSRAIAIRDGTGRIVRIRGMSQDVTERREAEAKLREREALVEHAERIANIGSWQYDFATQKVTLSPNLSQILGRGSGGEWTAELFWSRVYPEDRDRALAIRDRDTAQGKAFEYEVRYLAPEGGMRFLQVRGMTIFESARKPLRRIGVVQDVTERHDAEEKIREHEALMTNAGHVANFGLWQFDTATQKVKFSAKMRELYGLGDDEEWSSESCWERVHPEDRLSVREAMARGAKGRNPFEFVMRFTPVGGSQRYFHVRGAPQIDSTGRVVRSAGIAQDITERVRSEEELRRLSQQLLRARDDERRHIARELHETAGQSLAALKMTLGQLGDTMTGADDLARALLKSARELADAAVREVRTVSYLMHPPMLDDLGLAPALRWYARGFAERSGIRVHADIPEDLPRQSQEIEITIFRIVQEALTNVHRYSGSRTANIRIECGNGEIRAEVRDEGRGLGFPIRTWNNAEALGVGIAGMRERVQQLNGVFELESPAGKGTTVRVTLPTGAAKAQAAGRGAESGSPATSKGEAKSHGA